MEITVFFTLLSGRTVRTLDVLIISDEPIFSFGLRAQFQKWGFTNIAIALTCELSLQHMLKQTPALIILDEKFIKEQAYGTLELMGSFLSIPFILLCSLKNHTDILEEEREIRNKHTHLPKPCHITELQATVENLLHIQVMEV